MAKRGLGGAILKLLGAKDQVGRVVAVHDLTAHYRRVDLQFDSFLATAELSPTAWVRAWFPSPDGGDQVYQRAYTVAAVDHQQGLLSLEFVLHEPAGPASTWARRVQVGQRLALTQFGSSKWQLPSPAPQGYLLFGDAAAVPALNSLVRALPPTIPTRLLLAAYHSDDQAIPLAAPPEAVTWIRPTRPVSLAAAVEEADWTGWHAWAAVEGAALRPLRSRLKELGFARDQLRAQAYWLSGRAMGTTHRPGR